MSDSIRWAPVESFASYEVSDAGQASSVVTGLALKQLVSNSGYLYTQLWRDNKKHSQFVHRLVAAAFCDGRSELRPLVNHIDGNKRNNSAQNLAWCSPSENSKHAHDVLGVRPPVRRGQANTGHRPVVRIDPRTGEERLFPTMTVAASEGFDIRGIYAVCCGEQKTHYGFAWKYAAGARTKSHNTASPIKPLYMRGGSA